MLIKELSYKLNEYAEPVQLPIQNQSGIFKENAKPVRQGTLFVTEITGYIPKVTPERDAELKTLVELGAIFEAKDAEDNLYIVGTDELKASLELDKKNEGKAGSKFGYDLKITWNSANGAEFKSFQ